MHAAGGSCVVEGVEQQLGAEPSALEQRLAHGGEPGVGRHLDVVEADDETSSGTWSPAARAAVEHTERLRVGRREDRGRAIGLGEEFGEPAAPRTWGPCST